MCIYVFLRFLACFLCWRNPFCCSHSVVICYKKNPDPPHFPRHVTVSAPLRLAESHMNVSRPLWVRGGRVITLRNNAALCPERRTQFAVSMTPVVRCLFAYLHILFTRLHTGDVHSRPHIVRDLEQSWTWVYFCWPNPIQLLSVNRGKTEIVKSSRIIIWKKLNQLSCNNY